MKIFDYLDSLIGDKTPTLIIMNEETYNKLREKLKQETLDNSWLDKEKNYKGIPIEIKPVQFVEIKND